LLEKSVFGLKPEWNETTFQIRFIFLNFFKICFCKAFSSLLSTRQLWQIAVTLLLV
jgi:hypothetical protein